MNMNPKEIVAYLDNYIVGQQDAKRVIALALRTRYRRLQLPQEMQEEITPKNILMIGSTGVGKTEISRRLAKMMKVPFLKVEASKFTEVGFVGRDVESMVRDLVAASIAIVKKEKEQEYKEQIENYIINKIVEKLLPPLSKSVSKDKQDSYQGLLKKMEDKVLSGEMDDKIIEIEILPATMEFNDSNLPPEMIKVQESLANMFSSASKDKKVKSVTIKQAKGLLKQEASAKLIDSGTIHIEAIKRAQEGGIIFLDEIDKIAVSSKSQGRNDPSKEGVQRDLLPIVEGSSVTTKYGIINTDHILFIAAGAFHLCSPSDLIPELQGRFPLRVELESLTQGSLYQILTQTKNSLLRQYTALLSVEGVKLEFSDESIKELAKISFKANELKEDIGARRLHTVLEKVIEDISFNANEFKGQTYTITPEIVRQKLDLIVNNEDLSRYIL